MERVVQGYRFDDEKPIAIGVSSATYRAVREGAASVEIPVTIKVIDMRVAFDTGEFPRGSELLDGVPLHHGNIVDVRDVIRIEKDKVGIVRELVDGPSMAQILDWMGGHPLPPEVSLYVAKQCAAGLAYAHARNTIHGDLCHRHVLLSRDGQVKITDFQVSSLLAKAARAETSLLAGKRFYVAPEQRSQSPQLTPAVDVFSLGVLLFRMVAGRYPFPDSQIPQDGRFVAPSFPDEQWAAPLSDLLADALAYHPEERPSADDVWRRIRRILGPGWPGYGASELAEFLENLQARVTRGTSPVRVQGRHTGPRRRPSTRPRPGPLEPPPLTRGADPGESTQVTRAWGQDHKAAGDKLAPGVDTELRASVDALSKRIDRVERATEELLSRPIFSITDDPLIQELMDRLANLEEAHSFLAREVTRMRLRMDALLSALAKVAQDDQNL